MYKDYTKRRPAGKLLAETRITRLCELYTGARSAWMPQQALRDCRSALRPDSYPRRHPQTRCEQDEPEPRGSAASFPHRSVEERTWPTGHLLGSIRSCALAMPRAGSLSYNQFRGAAGVLRVIVNRCSEKADTAALWRASVSAPETPRASATCSDVALTNQAGIRRAWITDRLPVFRWNDSAHRDVDSSSDVPSQSGSRVTRTSRGTQWQFSRSWEETSSRLQRQRHPCMR
jgi:hypothetical protein